MIEPRRPPPLSTQQQLMKRSERMELKMLWSLSTVPYRLLGTNKTFEDTRDRQQTGTSRNLRKASICRDWNRLPFKTAQVTNKSLSRRNRRCGGAVSGNARPAGIICSSFGSRAAQRFSRPLQQASKQRHRDPWASLSGSLPGVSDRWISSHWAAAGGRASRDEAGKRLRKKYSSANGKRGDSGLTEI